MEQFENVDSNQAAVGQVSAEGCSGTVSHPVFMPETCTGQGHDWSDWSQQLCIGMLITGTMI